MRDSDERVTTALQIINRDFEGRLRLREVASQIAISHEYLARLLRKHTGKTFLGHLSGTRLREAQRLLTYTSLSMKEVATRCGFESTTQLDRHFQSAFGQTPREYRRSMETLNIEISNCDD